MESFIIENRFATQRLLFQPHFELSFILKHALMEMLILFFTTFFPFVCIHMRMVQLVRRQYPVPWYRVPCTMVHPPVPRYRVTPNYARFLIVNNKNSIKIFFQVLDITNHDKFFKICFAVCFFISDNAGSI